jgi:hypothetical protein
VGDGHVPKAARVVDHVDRAPVGDAADRQIGDRAQRLVVVERGVERRAHVGKELAALECALAGLRGLDARGRVADDDPDPGEAAVAPCTG